MSGPRQTLIMIVVMTIMMGLILSAVFTWQAIGFSSGFLAAWAGRFIATYAIVLPTVLVVSPVAQWVARNLDRLLFGAPGGVARPRDVALAAWKANAAGHAGESFEPWFDSLSDDVSITMPLGPFRGENRGKLAARQIYTAIAAARPRLVYETPMRVSESGQTVVLEFDDHGSIGGAPYKNRIAASFDVKDGKIAAYREYFGDIDPGVVAMMAAKTPAPTV